MKTIDEQIAEHEAAIAVDLEALKKPIPHSGGHYQMGWNDCLDKLAAQGYLHTPDRAEQERVMKVMGALQQLVNEVNHIEATGSRPLADNEAPPISMGSLRAWKKQAREALAEYEKLKGKL